MDKEKAMKKYITNMALRGYSPLTIRNYTYIINDFLKKFEIPDEKSTDAYILSKPNTKKNSKATQVRILRSYGKFLQKEYELSFTLPEPPKTGKTLPIFLTKSEVKVLLKSASSNIRDLTLLSFIIYTGVRVGELVDLKLCNVNLAERFVKILGKGERERLVPINEELARLVEAYLSQRKDNSEYLFVSKYGKRFTPLAIQLLVKKYGKIAELNKTITPHKLRHTFATLALESGVSPITISELLGHTSLNTTMKYTHVTNQLTEEAVQRISEFTNLNGTIREALKNET